jgi:hypothetical protein
VSPDGSAAQSLEAVPAAIVAPDAGFVLRSTMTSPYGRKVRIAIDVIGLSGRIRRVDANPLDESDTLRQQNPLGKMPVLLLADGSAIYDSRVIIEFLQEVAGTTRLVPAAGLKRYQALTRAALADGIVDAALLMVYERRFRSPESAFETVARSPGRQDCSQPRRVRAVAAGCAGDRHCIDRIGLRARLSRLARTRGLAFALSCPGQMVRPLRHPRARLCALLCRGRIGRPAHGICAGPPAQAGSTSRGGEQSNWAKMTRSPEQGSL